MDQLRTSRDFTVYLEGHEGHQGNVLAHAFVSKVQELILVLNKLERAFIATGTRQTDFEIIGADKRNPTTLTLKPVAKAKNYNPLPALEWSIEQIEAVSRGDMPDRRVRSDIANGLVKLATRQSEEAYTNFWINGHTAPVRFDADFLANATRIARQRALEDSPTQWHEGAAVGEIVGELKKVDDLDVDNEFVLVPPTGADAIRCKFPESMKNEIGQYLFKVVRVKGTLHYGKLSPFPYLVDAHTGGINLYPERKSKKTLLEMRGIFAGRKRDQLDWGSLLGSK